MGSVTRVRRTWKVVLVRPVNVVSLERINMRRTGWGSLEVPVWIALKPALRFVSCIFSFLFFSFFFWSAAAETVALFLLFRPFIASVDLYTVYETHKYHLTKNYF